MLKTRAIIFDLDGCVVDSQARYLQSCGDEALAAGDYLEFRRAMMRYALADHTADSPIPHGIAMVSGARVMLAAEAMIAITARGDEGRAPTTEWLRKHLPWRTDSLFMRPAYTEYAPGVYWIEGEPKFDAVEYKRGLALDLMKEFEVVAAFDDHVDVCHMYWEIGIPSFCVMIPGIDQGTRVQHAISGVVLQG